MFDAFIELKLQVWGEVLISPPPGRCCRADLSMLKLSVVICPGQLSPAFCCSGQVTMSGSWLGNQELSSWNRMLLQKGELDNFLLLIYIIFGYGVFTLRFRFVI